MDAHLSNAFPSDAESPNLQNESTAADLAALESKRRRRRVMELDRSVCITRLSHRRLLLRMQAASSNDLLSDPMRFYGGARRTVETGRAVDWD